MMDFYNQTLHVARKEHECEFCGKKIMPKEKYSYETGKYDGDFLQGNYVLHVSICLENIAINMMTKNLIGGGFRTGCMMSIARNAVRVTNAMERRRNARG